MKTIKLKFPITKKSLTSISDVVIEEIQIRKPKAFDLMGLNFANEHIMASMVFLISKLTGQPVDLIKELDSYDFFQIQNEVNKMITGVFA